MYKKYIKTQDSKYTIFPHHFRKRLASVAKGLLKSVLLRVKKKLNKPMMFIGYYINVLQNTYYFWAL